MGEILQNIFLESLTSYKTIFEKSLDPILLMDGHEFILCNNATANFLKLDSKEKLNKIHPSEISPEFQPCGRSSKEKADEIIERVYKNGKERFHWVHKDSEGELFWVEITIITIEIENKDYLYVMWHDIGDQKKAEEELRKINEDLAATVEERNRDLLNSLKIFDEYKNAIDKSLIVSKTDLKGYITYVNQEFLDISKYSEEELIGKPHNIIRHPDSEEKVFQDMWKTIKEKKIWMGVIKNRDKFGKAYYVKSTITPILDENGEIKEFIAFRTNVTEIYEQEQIIKRQKKDSLTGLPNRIELIEDLKTTHSKKLALFNIDRFRDLNDTYGHEIGDKLLKRFAKQISYKLPEKVKLYRLYGDEFGILGDEHTGEDAFISLCQKLLSFSKNKSFHYKEYEFELPIRVGISFDNENTLVQAEIAITLAREESSGIYLIGKESKYKETIENNITWTKKIKTAIKENHFAVFTQNIHPLKESLPMKCESLVRLIEDDGKVVSPFFFLDIAKKARLYPEISQFVINESFKKLCCFEGKFSINLTTDDILNQYTVNLILNNLKECGGKNVIFEIVESEGIENFDEISEFIKIVKDLGCEVAIDDFGTGYSNFEYIVKLDVDILKVDGSLIKNIHKEKHLRSTVEAIVSFAKGIGLTTVAEFVHCQEVLEIVKDLGFDYAQGFLLDEPKAI